MESRSYPLNSYVKVEILKDRKHKKKTRTIKSNSNPKYDEAFQFQIQLADLKKKQLLVVVKNDIKFYQCVVSSVKQLALGQVNKKSLVFKIILSIIVIINFLDNNRSIKYRL